MPDSIRKQILDAAVTALNASGTKPCTFFRSRVEAAGASERPIGIVRPVEESAERKGPNITLHELTMRVEVIADADGAAVGLDALLEPVLVYVVQTLYASSTFLNLLARASDGALNEKHVQWNFEPGHEDVGLAFIDFEVAYLTKAQDPTVNI